MPRVSELVADRAEAKVHLELGDVTIVYRPRVLTTEWQQKIAAAEEAGSDQETTLFTPLREVLVSWDLTDDDDKPYEFTREALEQVPRQILTNVLMFVVMSARPNQQRLLGQSTVGSSEPSTQPTPMRTPSRRTGTS